MDELLKRIKKFRDDRDWKQFHTPENLSKSIIIEAAELLENFQWDDTYDKENVMDEIADVMNYCLLLADTLDIDIIANMNRKMDINEDKYPVDLVKGSSKKYNEYKTQSRVKKQMKKANQEGTEKSSTDGIKKTTTDKGSGAVFDLDENPWDDDDYLGETPFPRFG